ncbi:MAG TPA: sigma 54-interacting transcriptional regulator [Candidatus Polarisedimenticolaceae bacterium]|nr:sigma 54-interacting transcriptional regulator [Candidatus Polarisedimenticolaceae bacterium]
MGEEGAARFVIHRLLGEGGAGRVWLVGDRKQAGRSLALKELTSSHTPQHEAAFRREFATLAGFHHPGVVEVEEFDVDPASGLPRFTLEYVEGRDFVEAIRHEGRDALVPLTVEALRAIAFLHDFGLIHRDLKPANVLVRQAPKLGSRVVLVDFGLALAEHEPSVEARRAAGTLAYLAPEILSNASPSRRSDLFALGAIVREATGGVAPRAIADWIDAMTAESPRHRPASAAEALARLNEAAGTEHPIETPATRAARLRSGAPAGRDRIVGAIESALDSAAAPHLIWISGEPGSGKTRFLRWIEAGAIRRGALAVRGLPDAAILDRALTTRIVALVDDGRADPDEIRIFADRLLAGPVRLKLTIVAAVRAFSRPLEAPDAFRFDLGSLSEQGLRAMAERATGGAVSDERVAWLAEASLGSPARAEAVLIEGAWERGAEVDPARYAEALDLVGRDRVGRAALRRRQAEALLRSGRHRAAARAAGAALFLASESDRGAILLIQALALVQSGRFRRALAVAEEAARRAEAEGNDARLGGAKRALGIGLARLGREAEAVPVLEEAVTLARGAADLRAEAEALHALAACHSRLGDDRAEAELSRAVVLYAQAAAADPAAALDGQDLRAQVGLAVLHGRARRYDEAARLLASVRREAASRGNPGLQEIALSKSALNAIDLGRLDRAIDWAEQAADLAGHLGDRNLVLVSRMALADAQIRCGRAGEAAAGLREALAGPQGEVEPENADYARMLLADAWGEAGGGDESAIAALLASSLERCRARGKGRALLMGLVIEMERRARLDAHEPFEPARAEYDRLAAKADEVEPEIRIRAALAAGEHALVRGDLKTALGEAESARRIAKEVVWPAFQARGCALAGRALDRQGKFELADATASEGRALLHGVALRIENTHVRRDFLDRPVYAALRDEARVERGQARLRTLYDMIRVLNSERDPESLLETILDLALGAVEATRGMIFLREDRGGPAQGTFAVHLARNLEDETRLDAEEYSRHIVEAAGMGRPILAIDAGTDERFRELKSVSLYRIRSLMCVPLRSRGRVIGTVYLDSRVDGRLFTQDDLRFVEALADQAAIAIENTRLRARLERENRRLAAAAEATSNFGYLVGRSPAMRAVYSLIEKVADTQLPVLIRGESGTGKELVARAIHARSPRRRQPFLGENCAAIPEALLESELFGHVRGAFTGADRPKPGLFEQADGGTLFLDEVGDMSPAMQVRLLRVVEEGVIRPVGGEKTLEVDVRLITATHRDLGDAIRNGTFRQDLLYRLQVLTVELPALRDRPGDIPVLVAHVLERIAAERKRPPLVVDDEAFSLFERYHWPGNVRELQNALQRLALLAGDREISAALIASDPVMKRALMPSTDGRPSAYSLVSGEKSHILQAIQAANGNRSEAAKLLGVSRATLYRKIGKHRL